MQSNPCPFCGHKELNIVTWVDESNNFFDSRHVALACANCQARGPASSSYHGAIAHWNYLHHTHEANEPHQKLELHPEPLGGYVKPVELIPQSTLDYIRKNLKPTFLASDVGKETKRCSHNNDGFRAEADVWHCGECGENMNDILEAEKESLKIAAAAWKQAAKNWRARYPLLEHRNTQVLASLTERIDQLTQKLPYELEDAYVIIREALGLEEGDDVKQTDA